MFSPTVRHRCWNTAVEPVKWMPARSRSASTTSETATPSPGTRLMTPGGRPGLLQQPHREVRGEQLGRRRLPHDRVAHQRGRGRQVAGDRGEVEGRDRVDEALERAVVDAVPDAGRGLRLLGHDLAREVHVEAPEVDQLAGGCRSRPGSAVLLWPSIVAALSGLPPRPGQQVGRLEEDRGAVVEGELAPAGGGVLGAARRRPRRRRASRAPSVPRTAACRCGWTTSNSRPRGIRSSPPMVIVSSNGASTSSVSRSSSAARSGEPGA